MNAPVRSWQISRLEQQALMSGWGAKTMVAPIWGHFDESGEEGADGKLKRLTLGGFFAPWPEISILCKKWRDALDKEGLGDFHMKDIASDEHDFDNWPADRQERLKRFVDILCDHAAHFGAYSYKVITKRNVFVQSYKPALARVLIELEKICIENGARGNIVFAQTKEISNELIGRFFDGANWSGWFDGYSVSRASNEPALQAAEIVARSMKQLMQDGTVTYSFSRIIGTKHLSGLPGSQAKLERFAKEPIPPPSRLESKPPRLVPFEVGGSACPRCLLQMTLKIASLGVETVPVLIAERQSYAVSSPCSNCDGFDPLESL